MSPVLCRLTSALPPGARRAPVTRAHVRSCLRCQALGARERGMRRELRVLGDTTIPAPPYLAASVMARLGSQGSRRVRGRIPDVRVIRAAAAGVGVGAAAAAAVITGMVLRKARTAA
jgi:hypothetical protein